jgi:hypothetical protein
MKGKLAARPTTFGPKRRAIFETKKSITRVYREGVARERCSGRRVEHNRFQGVFRLP